MTPSTTTRDARARAVAVVGALMLSAFLFNTTENLPIGLLRLIADDLDVSEVRVGHLVSGYGLVVAAASLPLAYLTRAVPRRLLLTIVLGVLVIASAVPMVVESYAALLVARVLTALAQALFWAVQGPVAVALFPPAVRGRVVGILSAGGALATIAGVPAGTWLGHHATWELPFVTISLLGLVALTVVGAALPTTRPDSSDAAYGSAPDRRHFLAVVTVTALSTAGVFFGFTYVMTYLGSVTHLSSGQASALLAAFGIGGFLGVSVVGSLLDRFPHGTLVAPVVLQALALLALYVGGESHSVAGASILLLGASAGPVFMATQNQVLRVSPGRTELGMATNSAAFNVGVAAGAAGGGWVLAHWGVRETFLAGGLLTLLGLAALVPGRRPPTGVTRPA